MASTYWYGNSLVRAFTELAAGGGTAKTWKVALLDEAHVIDPTDTYWSDVSANEATGTGYTAGGAALSGVTLTYAAGTFAIDAADWAPVGVTVSARYAVVYLSTGTGTTSPLVSITDLTEGGEVDVTGLAVHSSGIATVAIPTP